MGFATTPSSSLIESPASGIESLTLTKSLASEIESPASGIESTASTVTVSPASEGAGGQASEVGWVIDVAIALANTSRAGNPFPTTKLENQA
ncbi:MAG: hypothetical protein MJE68_07410 [Proteobacteria bacterium]|nr:hypothetical protein [Pseudomonadota bacterium]